MHPAIKKLWDRLPRVVQDTIASTVDRLEGNGVPAAPRAPLDREVRLMIGPTNYAGQADRWARAVEADPTVFARSMVSEEINVFAYPTDYSVRWRTMTHSRAWQRDLFASLTQTYTHVIIEAETPILGGMLDSDVVAQTSALQRRGVSVAMLCHGTDVRLPSAHRAREPWSMFVDDAWAPVHLVEANVRENLRILDEVDAPAFVSTPDLLHDVPDAAWLPVVIDPDRWVSSIPALSRRRPTVVHVPSNPIPKGTHLIEPTVQALADAGLITYVSARGLTHDRMTDLIRSADIVLDQFRIGDYGVGACESMAAGRLVISHVSDDARGVVRNRTGLELPILEATVESLESVLRGVLENPTAGAEFAAAGPAFVRQVHDGRLSRSVLEREFLRKRS